MMARFVRMEAKIRSVENTRDVKAKLCDRNFILKTCKTRTVRTSMQISGHEPAIGKTWIREYDLKTSVLVRAVPFWFFFLIPWSPS
jgi:hypothetical protein